MLLPGKRAPEHTILHRFRRSLRRGGDEWCPRQELNLRFRLRRPAVYPLTYWGNEKNSTAFCVVCASTSATLTFLIAAIAFTISTTNAGSLRLPRYGIGAKNGASVSTMSCVRGHRKTVSRIAKVFGYVMMPVKDNKYPIFMNCSTSSKRSEQQWRTSFFGRTRSTIVQTSSIAFLQ